MKEYSAFPITGTSPSDCLESYLGYSLSGEGSDPYVEKVSVYSTAPADWAEKENEVHAFSESICPKVNILARLEFELANYDVADQQVCYYAPWTVPLCLLLLNGMSTTNGLLLWP